MNHRLNGVEVRNGWNFHQGFSRVLSLAKMALLACVVLLLAACTPPQKSAGKSEPAALKSVTAIAVFPTELPLIAGAAPHRVVVTATDKEGFELPAPARFSSDNLAVATVSANGKIRPLAPGNATITVKSNGKSAIVKVTVKSSVRADVVQLPPAG
ncbi:MAG: hypothetical protein FJ392_09950, partial [Verrucomicrobia bacterium]|nr:hypothetical protein [Verrucomicrobiota bacterium]